MSSISWTHFCRVLFANATFRMQKLKLDFHICTVLCTPTRLVYAVLLPVVINLTFNLIIDNFIAIPPPPSNATNYNYMLEICMMCRGYFHFPFMPCHLHHNMMDVKMESNSLAAASVLRRIMKRREMLAAPWPKKRSFKV